MGRREPGATSWRPRGMRIRGLIGSLLALGMLAVPVASVQACSCSFLGGTMDVVDAAIAGSDLAFIGTVVDTAVEPADADGFDHPPMVRYAFAVERSTLPVAEVVEVRALDDGGGGSCGFTFGLDETWFVAAYEQDGALLTGLCSGNVETHTLANGERGQIAAMLTAEPVPSPAPAASGSTLFPVAGVVLGVLVLGAVTVLLFRRSSPS
jgi:hypothetical protein